MKKIEKLKERGRDPFETEQRVQELIEWQHEMVDCHNAELEKKPTFVTTYEKRLPFPEGIFTHNAVDKLHEWSQPKEQEECKHEYHLNPITFGSAMTFGKDKKFSVLGLNECEDCGQPMLVKQDWAEYKPAQTECEHPAGWFVYTVDGGWCRKCSKKFPEPATPPQSDVTPGETMLPKLEEHEKWQPIIVAYETIANKWAIRAGEFESKEEAETMRDAIQKLLKGKE